MLLLLLLLLWLLMVLPWLWLLWVGSSHWLRRSCLHCNLFRSAWKNVRWCDCLTAHPPPFLPREVDHQAAAAMFGAARSGWEVVEQRVMEGKACVAPETHPLRVPLSTLLVVGWCPLHVPVWEFLPRGVAVRGTWPG